MDRPHPGPRWRFLITPRWLAWHAFAVCAFLGCLALGDWQLHRALAGNALSWAYTFEWPLFAIMGAVFWAKTIRDEFRIRAGRAAPDAAGVDRSDQRPGVVAVASSTGRMPAGTVGSAVGAPGPWTRDDEEEPEDPELAAYNAYLARLNAEAEDHGRRYGPG